MLNRIANPHVRSLVEWLIAIGLAVLFFFFARNFLFRVAHVDGSSMNPTLEHGDMVILNRLGLLLSDPRPGDIVAFPYPNNPSEHHIKRIIGTPGDTVDLRDGFFYVNDTRLNDDFSVERVFAVWDVAFPLTVEEDVYFVLGDNRNASKDSRFSTVGNIHASDMVGRVLLRVWPLGRFGNV